MKPVLMPSTYSMRPSRRLWLRMTTEPMRCSCLAKFANWRGKRSWMARPRIVRSRAVVTCSGFGRPDALRKTVFLMPSACALRVIRRAKVTSSPAMASATAAAMSLADFVMRAPMAFSTVIVDPGRSPTFVGGMEAACAEIGIGVSIRKRPRSICSNSR